MTESVALWEIFVFLLGSSLLSFGGGNGQVPVIEAQWVQPGILAPGLFSFALGLSYLTPGPKGAFVAGIGYYLAGFPGAAVAVVALVLPTCIGASAVSYAAKKMEKIVALVAPSAGFVLAGLIAAAAWGTAAPMGLGVPEIMGVIAVAALVIWTKIEPVWLVLGAVTIGLGWSLVM